MLKILSEFEIHGIAHITGGGITENLPRIMPADTYANIELDNWVLPTIFEILAETGPIQSQELLRTFNCGIGMALIVPPHQSVEVTSALNQLGESVFEIGSVSAGKHGDVKYTGVLI